MHEVIIREIDVGGGTGLIGCDDCPIPHRHPGDRDVGGGGGRVRSEALSLDASPYNPEEDVAAFLEICEPDEEARARQQERRGGKAEENVSGTEATVGGQEALGAERSGGEGAQGSGGQKSGERVVTLREFHEQRKRKRGYAAMSTGGPVVAVEPVKKKKAEKKKSPRLVISDDEDEEPPAKKTKNEELPKKTTKKPKKTVTKKGK
jgi:hypothetical protein